MVSIKLETKHFIQKINNVLKCHHTLKTLVSSHIILSPSTDSYCWFTFHSFLILKRSSYGVRVLDGQKGDRLSHLISKVGRLGQNLMRSPTDRILSGRWGPTPNLCLLHLPSITLYAYLLSHFRSPPNEKEKDVAQNLLWHI